MDKVYSIYLVTNTINGKNYVGFTGDFEKRKKDHIYYAYCGSTLFSKALQEFGLDAFTWTIIYQSKDKKYLLDEMEGYFIELYDAYSRGYNSKNGNGFSNKKTLEPDEKSSNDTSRIPTFRACRYCSSKEKSYIKGRWFCNTCFPGGKFTSASEIKKAAKNKSP